MGNRVGLQAAFFSGNTLSIAFLLLAIFSIAPKPVVAQANVIENEPITLYVDTLQGSDSNPGSQSQPFKTIGAGVLQAERNTTKGVGTKVLVNPGVYREYVNITSYGASTGAPITLEAAQTGAVVIAGSDVFTNWYQGTGNPAIYSHSWNYAFGNCAIPSGWPAVMLPILLRTEMVYVNGIPLTQVMAFNQMMAGTFFVDETSGQIQIWPVAGTNMGTALIEVATRAHTLQVNARSNVVLRGLVFEHAATCLNQNGANIFSSNNVLVDSIHSYWNNFGGFGVETSTNVTLQNSVASHNGGVGFHSYRGKQILYQYIESDYNNWRGAQGAFYDFAMGGTKFFALHGGAVNQVFAYNNQAQGLWFDTDNRQVAVQNATLSGNVVDNLQIELNVGPIAVQNSTLCYGQVGLNLINASQLTVTGSTFFNNGGSTAHMAPQFYLEGKPGGRSFTDWETGQFSNVISSNITFGNNVFEDGSPNQDVFATYQVGSDWSAFESTFSSNNNRWYDPIQTTAFRTSSQRMALTGWQTYTGQDTSSTWAHTGNVAQNCAAPPVTYADFSMTVDSPAFSLVSGKATMNLQLKQFLPGNGVSPLTGSGQGGAPAGASPPAFSISGLPTGVTASFSSPTVTSTGLGFAVTVSASTAAVQQTVPVTIFAQSGGRVHTITVLLSVGGTGVGCKPPVSEEPAEQLSPEIVQG